MKRWKEINEKRRVANKEIYIELADELGITEAEVERMVKAQSDLIVKVIQRGALESVQIYGLGKIKPNTRKAMKYNEKRKPKA